MDVAIALPAGLVVGAVLGLLGAGGSLLTVPALMLLLGLTATDATGTALVAVAMMAAAGVVMHRRAGRCSCREGAIFGAAAAVMAAGSGWLATGLSDRFLTGAFIVLLIGSATWLLRRGRRDALAAEAARPGDERDVSTAGAATAGAGVGVLTGMLGVGGGFLIVPALVATREMRMPLAVGTSQLIVLVSALGGLLGRAPGGSVQWELGLLFGLGGLAGAVLGSSFVGRARAETLRVAFAAVALMVAGVLAWQVVGAPAVA